MTKKMLKILYFLGNRRAVLSWLFIFLAIFLFIFYVISVNLTVFTTAKRAKLEKETSFLHLQIGQLESELLLRKNELNVNLAKSLGFQEAQKIKFISAKSVATILGTASIQ